MTETPSSQALNDLPSLAPTDNRIRDRFFLQKYVNSYC